MLRSSSESPGSSYKKQTRVIKQYNRYTGIPDLSLGTKPDFAVILTANLKHAWAYSWQKSNFSIANNALGTLSSIFEHPLLYYGYWQFKSTPLATFANLILILETH